MTCANKNIWWPACIPTRTAQYVHVHGFLELVFPDFGIAQAHTRFYVVMANLIGPVYGCPVE